MGTHKVYRYELVWRPDLSISFLYYVHAVLYIIIVWFYFSLGQAWCEWMLFSSRKTPVSLEKKFNQNWSTANGSPNKNSKTCLSHKLKTWPLFCTRECRRTSHRRVCEHCSRNQVWSAVSVNACSHWSLQSKPPKATPSTQTLPNHRSCTSTNVSWLHRQQGYRVQALTPCL